MRAFLHRPSASSLRNRRNPHRMPHPNSAARQIHAAQVEKQPVDLVPLQRVRGNSESLPFLSPRPSSMWLDRSSGLFRGVGGVDGGAEDAQFVRSGEDFKAAAL